MAGGQKHKNLAGAEYKPKKQWKNTGDTGLTWGSGNRNLGA